MRWVERCKTGAPLWPFVGPEGLTLRPFSPTDPLRIAPRGDFALEHRLAGSPLFGAERVEGPCWTLTDGELKWAKPLACGGLEPNGHGRFTGWLFSSDLSPRAWVMVRAAMQAMVREAGARRVEITVRSPVEIAQWPDALRACAFAEALGLSREGLLKGFGPDGSDYFLYAGVF